MANKKLNVGSAGVTGTNGTADVLSNVFEWLVPKGLGVAIPGRFKFLLKLLSAPATELPDVAEVYFGYKTPSDTRRTVPIGSMILYEPFASLSTAEQQDVDFQASVLVDLGHDFLVLREDERLVIQVFSTVAVSVANSEFYLPYAERDPHELMQELRWRASWWGR